MWTRVRPAMLHGSKIWPVKKAETDRLHRAEMTMVQWMCGSCLKTRISSTELRTKLGGITPITEVARRRRLRWYGHVMRRENDNWLRKACDLEVSGKACVGRPTQSWSSVVNDDIKTLGIDKNLALNRDLWRAAIS